MTYLASALLGLSLTASASAPTESSLHDELLRLSRRTVLFGHQSVGANLLDGMRYLAASSGVAVRIVQLDAAAPIPAGTLAHAYVDRNGDARAKLDSFARLLAGTEASPPDVAMLKLCWADFDRSTDAEKLFHDYEAALAQLAKSYPRTRFIHVTVPLTTVQGGAKGFAKRLLGIPPHGLLENARREQFNDLLRARYDGREPLFDLARLEAWTTQGSTSVVLDGRHVLALAPENTNDGGHLVPAAQERIARSLITLLAAP